MENERVKKSDIIDMDKVKILIRQKPRIYVYITLTYLLCVGLFKWVTHPDLEAVWFFMGGAIGLYFLDAAELFFALVPSPFRSIVFGTLFALVAFFVVTSSSGTIGSGLVLSIYLQMVLWQIGEWNINGHMNSWYRMIADPVHPSTQRMILAGFSVFFFIISYLFIQ